MRTANRSIVWPTVGVWSASLPGTDVILLLGPEPALRWRLFSEQVTGIADRFEATMAISVGALLADVPHSRPVPLIGTASDNSLIERFDLQRSQYEGPTGIIGVLHDALHQAGLPTASLWAAVPGYAAQVPSPKAAMALVDRACSMIGTPPPCCRACPRTLPSTTHAWLRSLAMTTTWSNIYRVWSRWPTRTMPPTRVTLARHRRLTLTNS